MVEQFENNYVTQLNGAIDSDDTTLVVDAGPDNMTGSFRIRIDEELILVGNVSGTSLTSCTRGIEGTTPASHSDDTVVEHVLTAASLQQTIKDTTWDIFIIKASDFGVTNSNTFADDSELTFAVLDDQIWEMELTCLFTSDATGDWKFRLNTGGFALSVFHYFGSDATNNAVQGGEVRETGTATTAIAGGGGTITITRMLKVYFMMMMNADGNITVQIAQNTTTSGQTATLKAGSYLKARRLV
jgi:hypothetical protein